MSPGSPNPPTPPSIRERYRKSLINAMNSNTYIPPPEPEIVLYESEAMAKEANEKKIAEAYRQMHVAFECKSLTAYQRLQKAEPKQDTFTDVFPYPPPQGYNTYESAIMISSSSSSSSLKDDGGGGKEPPDLNFSFVDMTCTSSSNSQDEGQRILDANRDFHDSK